MTSLAQARNQLLASKANRVAEAISRVDEAQAANDANAPHKENLNDFLSDHLIGQYAKEVSKKAQFPINTSTLMSLGVVSQLTSMVAKVEYADGKAIPCGLMVMGEQPSGAAKSRVIDTFRKPISNLISKENKLRAHKAKAIQSAADADKRELHEAELADLQKSRVISFDVKSTTAEALEMNTFRQDGFFALATSEQGLMKTLLGFLYNDGKSCDDLLLNGFDGDFYQTSRVNEVRNGSGFVHGSLCTLAQKGQIDQLLKKSSGSGLAERFLLVSEPSVMGSRSWEKMLKGKKQHASLEQSYLAKVNSIFEAFKANKSIEFDNLVPLQISDNGWNLIIDHMQFNEHENGEDGRYFNSILSGMYSKKVPNIMKIAASLHMMSLDYSITPLDTLKENSLISDEAVICACLCVNYIFEHVVDMASEKRVTMADKRVDWLVGYLGKDSFRRSKTRDQIINAAKKNQLFPNKGCASSVDEMLQLAQAEQYIVIDASGKDRLYKLAD